MSLAIASYKSRLNTPFLVETRQKAKDKRQKKEKTSSKKGVIKADLSINYSFASLNDEAIAPH